jgi:hypothetical protein
LALTSGVTIVVGAVVVVVETEVSDDLWLLLLDCDEEAGWCLIIAAAAPPSIRGGEYVEIVSLMALAVSEDGTPPALEAAEAVAVDPVLD